MTCELVQVPGRWPMARIAGSVRFWSRPVTARHALIVTGAVESGQRKLRGRRKPTRTPTSMAKKRRKAARRGDAFKLRMTRALARHGLTLDEAGQLSDADLSRRRGIGLKMINVIRAARGPAPPPSPTADAAVTERGARDQRIAALERQVAELLEAVRQLQDLMRVRGIDRRGHAAREGPPGTGRYEPGTDETNHIG